MNKVRVPLAVFLILTAVSTARVDAAPDNASPTGFLFKSLAQSDGAFKYAVFVPRDYDPARKWPFIVFLHGAGECGTDGAKPIAQGIGTAILLDVEKWPFIVLFPQKPDVRDQWEKYDRAVMEMLQQARKDYNVDDSRLYLTGLSQGGHGAWVLGAKHADVWAAIAPVCGYGEPAEIAPALKSMPVWCFHGETDTAVPVKQSQAMVDAIKAEGGSPKLTLYPGVGHNSWDKAYREEKLYEWLLSNKRSGK
jgi:predicted peptidase